MANPDVYPITHEFEKQFEKEKTNTTIYTFNQIVQIFTETIGEYEHGTAESRNCEGVSLKQYKEVAVDLLLVLRHSE
jgi:hypothetical protein